MACGLHIIPGVCFAGVRAAVRGRRGSSGSGCNLCHINDLESATAVAKKGKYLHIHTQGEKVKAFAPVAL